MTQQQQPYCTSIEENITCTSTTSQYANVSVPIKLKPYAQVGPLSTECCGEPIITLRSTQGANCSCGLELTVLQTICIKIPIEYGTDADIGNTITNCKKNPCCQNNDYR